MAGWIPVLKASLPYVTQIVTAALPAFTSKPAPGQPDEVVPKQIAELQSAVTQNAESVKTLATQLKEAIEGIDAGAADQGVVALRAEQRIVAEATAQQVVAEAADQPVVVAVAGDDVVVRGADRAVDVDVGIAEGLVAAELARGDGSSEFSNDLASHNRAVNRYQRKAQ